MRVEILGSAAGGGFPQWNCNCPNCCSLRSGTFNGKRRSQTQVAVTQDERAWVLLNASPDLRSQIEASPQLHPRSGVRDSPIAAVILTSADIDQVAGLLSLRELQPFHIFCTNSIRRILQEDNSTFGMLNRVPNQVAWEEITPGEAFVPAEKAGIRCTPISLGKRYPAYVPSQRVATFKPEESLMGLVLEGPSGGRLAYLPAVPAIDAALIELLESSDVVLFDGTFWASDELIRVQGSGATAEEMGHVPVSGPNGSLRKLAGLRRPRKIFIHVNNTNPMLNEAGAEYREVRDAGWEIAEDGWSLEIGPPPAR